MGWFSNLSKKISNGVTSVSNFGKKVSAEVDNAQQTIDELQSKVTEVEDKIKNTVTEYEAKINDTVAEAATKVQKVQGELESLGTISYEAVSREVFQEIIQGATATKTGHSLEGKAVMFVYYKGPVQLGQTILTDGKYIHFKATYDTSIFS